MNTLLLSINWNPNPELFNLFGISIRYYGLLWAVGIFFAYIIVHYQSVSYTHLTLPTKA